jgi:hypothetical protein
MMLKCVLLDANVIIESYVLGVWEKLIDQTEMYVSSVIVKDEARFYSAADGAIPEPINLKKLISEEKIKEVTATAKEVKGFRDKFDSVFVEGLHDGEAECLALMMYDRVTNTYFCSADATAIQALSMIGHSAFGISFERLLQESGLTKKLRRHYRDRFFKKHIQIGSQNLITGQGLKR